MRQSAEANPSWSSRLVDADETVCKEETAPGRDVVRQMPSADAEAWCSGEHSRVPEDVA